MNAVGSSLIYSKGSLEQSLEKVKNMGFRDVELGVLRWCDLKPQQLVLHYDRELERVRHALEKYNLNAIALNAGLREDGFQEAQAIIRLASDLQVQMVTTNSSSPDTDYIQEVTRLKELVRLASEQGVQITIETHIDSMTEQPKNALKLVNDVPGLGLTLDLSHYYCNETEDQLEPLLPFVKHVHIRDFGRGVDQLQLPFGEGLLDLKGLKLALDKAKYDGLIAIEYIDLDGVKFDVEDSTLKSKQAIESIWGGNQHE